MTDRRNVYDLLTEWSIGEETFADTVGIKGRWVEMTPEKLRKLPELTNDLLQLINIAYAPIGGHLKFTHPDDLLDSVILVRAEDLDADPQADVALVSKRTPAGLKMTALGHDASPAAKRAAIETQAADLRKPGFYAEVSDALAHILLTRYRPHAVEDEEAVRRVLDRPIEWVGERPDGKYPDVKGWYYRNIAGHRKLKLLVGLPRGERRALREQSEFLSLDEAYRDVGFVDGKWGRAGSGLLFTTGETILLLKRSGSVEQPGTWGIPGGAIPEEDGKLMDALTSARKEAGEEGGSLPKHKIVDKYVFRDGSFTFTTFVARVDRQFTPLLNWESDAYDWVSRDEVHKLRLHPGVTELLKHVNPFDDLSEDLNEIASKKIGVYVLGIKDKPNEFAVCWSDKFVPNVAITLKWSFKTAGGDGRAWAGESTEIALRATPHVTPRTHIDQVKLHTVKRGDAAFELIEPFLRPENEVTQDQVVFREFDEPPQDGNDDNGFPVGELADAERLDALVRRMRVHREGRHLGEARIEARLGLADLVQPLDEAKKPLSEPAITEAWLSVGGIRLQVWVANEQHERELGLMRVEDLPPDTGMWFVYADSKPRSFWMKDTPAPLDLAFLDADGRITEIKRLRAFDTAETISTKPAKFALEMRAGWFEANGVDVGTKVTKFQPLAEGADEPKPTVLLDFPRVRQATNFSCGAAATQGLFRFYGVSDEREIKLIKKLGTNPKEGTRWEAIFDLLQQAGLRPRTQEESSVAEIRRLIDRGAPVLIALQAWSDEGDPNYADDWEDGHYVVAVGYDEHNLYFEDPSSFDRVYLSDEEFERRWHDQEGSSQKPHRLHQWMLWCEKEPVYDPEKVQPMGRLREAAYQTVGDLLAEAAPVPATKEKITHLQPDDRLILYHGTNAQGFEEMKDGVDATKLHYRYYNAPRHRGLFVSPSFELARKFGHLVILELALRAKNLHGTYYDGTIYTKKDDEHYQNVYPDSFRPSLAFTLLDYQAEPQALYVGMIRPSDILAVWVDGERVGLREAAERLGTALYGLDLASTTIPLDKFLAALKKHTGHTDAEAKKQGYSTYEEMLLALLKQEYDRGGKKEVVDYLVTGGYGITMPHRKAAEAIVDKMERYWRTHG